MILPRLVAVLFASPALPQAAASCLFFVPAPEQFEDQVLLAREYDVVRMVSGKQSGFRVVVTPEQRPVFEHLFPRAVVEGPSKGLVHDSRGYPSPAAVEDRMLALATEGGNAARLVSLTSWLETRRTHGERELMALRIGRGNDDQAAIVVTAGLHAREVASTTTALDVAARLVALCTEDPTFLADRSVWVVPVANPDGAQHVWYRDRWWRKNRSYNGGTTFGVDLNRNFAAGHRRSGGSSDPTSPVFRGARPGSEPEVETLAALLDRVRPDILIDLHTHGRQVLAPWTGTPLDSVLGDRARRLSRALGYRVLRPRASGLAVQAVTDHGGLAFILEVGTEFQAPESRVRCEGDRVWRGIEEILGWRAPLRGVVKSSDGRPCAATVAWANGKEALGRTGTDGRFALWLPTGEWELRFDGADESRSVNVAVTEGGESEAWTVHLERCNERAEAEDETAQEAGHRGQENLRR